jgi:hypothetical protein
VQLTGCACLPACPPARLPACPPACLPAGIGGRPLAPVKPGCWQQQGYSGASPLGGGYSGWGKCSDVCQHTAANAQHADKAQHGHTGGRRTGSQLAGCRVQCIFASPAPMHSFLSLQHSSSFAGKGRGADRQFSSPVGLYQSQLGLLCFWHCVLVFLDPSLLCGSCQRPVGAW